MAFHSWLNHGRHIYPIIEDIFISNIDPLLEEILKCKVKHKRFQLQIQLAKILHRKNNPTQQGLSSSTRKHGFLEGQLDKCVHIDQRVCPFWLKVWGMKNTCYFLPVNLIKMTFLTKCQAKNLIKMNKCSSKWAWLSQIGHIKWIGFNKIDHLDLTLSQIDHYDLTLSQMNHTDLMA
jgi:hypothetical protein